MPEFAYVAKDQEGARQHGLIEAANPSNVVDQLRSRGWLVVSVEPRTAGKSTRIGLSADWLAFRVRSIDLELSLRQLGVMLRGGMTLLSALDVLVSNASRRPLRRLWHQVSERIQGGDSFSQALAPHQSIPEFVIRLVGVGEQTGILDSVLVQGADMIRSRRTAKRDILTAIAYPALVLVAAIAVSLYMIVYLVPKLGNFLTGLGKPMPAMTQSLVDIAEFFQQHGIAILLGIATLLVALVTVYLSETGRLLIDRWVLRLPLFGKLFRLAGTVTFAQSLGVLIRSGVTIIEGLVTVEKMYANRYLARCVREARERVMQGKNLADSLQAHHAFMPLLPNMTAVGEQAGNLDDVLNEVAVFHEEQLQAMIQQLSAWITPVITVVVGTIVGYVYIAFFLALFAVTG